MPVSNLFNAPSTSSPLAAAPPRTAAPAVPPGQEKATAANMQIVQAIQECCRNIAKKLEEAAERIRSHDQGVKSDANNVSMRGERLCPSMCADYSCIDREAREGDDGAEQKARSSVDARRAGVHEFCCPRPPHESRPFVRRRSSSTTTRML